MMTPSMGRIVIFHDTDNADRPAVILRVYAPDSGPPYNGVRVDLCVFSGMGYGYIANVREGAVVGEWSWPERLESGDTLRALGILPGGPGGGPGL